MAEGHQGWTAVGEEPDLKVEISGMPQVAISEGLIGKESRGGGGEFGLWKREDRPLGFVGGGGVRWLVNGC